MPKLQIKAYHSSQHLSGLRPPFSTTARIPDITLNAGPIAETPCPKSKTTTLKQIEEAFDVTFICVTSASEMMSYCVFVFDALRGNAQYVPVYA
jgi:hypothetical protein